jgi:hypothetical protein
MLLQLRKPESMTTMPRDVRGVTENLGRGGVLRRSELAIRRTLRRADNFFSEARDAERK